MTKPNDHCDTEQKLKSHISRLIMVIDNLHPIEKPHDPRCSICTVVNAALEAIK